MFKVPFDQLVEQISRLFDSPIENLPVDEDDPKYLALVAQRTLQIEEFVSVCGWTLEEFEEKVLFEISSSCSPILNNFSFDNLLELN